VIKKLGYTEEELLARPIDSFIHPDDKENTRSKRASLLDGQELVNFQNRYITKQHEFVWLEWTSIYIPDREIVFAIAKDITSRKLVDQEIEDKYRKFKGLAAHFKKSIETDRKYLAIELHEELAQLATALKLDIDWLRNLLNNAGDEINNRIEHALAIADILIHTIRRISFSVSPHTLEEQGLDETLQWHCNEFAILNGIPCTYESRYDENDLSFEEKLDFFRICQESLTNIMYHARAKKVNIIIEAMAGKIQLSIADDGIGFDLDSLDHSGGLDGIRERATSINGELSIQSTKGVGTRIIVNIAKQLSKAS
jgi:PAS domain S-box-containing protein